MEKLENRHAGWKEKVLSLTSKTILVKAGALALPSYVMQTFTLPKHICERMDSIIRKSWWSFSNKKRHLYLMAWDSIYASKSARGLGFKKFHDINTAYITKLGWRMCKKPNKTWVKLVKSKYLRGRIGQGSIVHTYENPLLLDTQDFHIPIEV